MLYRHDQLSSVVRLAWFPVVLVALCLLACGGGGAGQGQGNASAQPDILLLVVDTLRADHLGTYRATVDFTPNLDRFARQAVVFEDAQVQGPNTINSSASLLTSTWVSEHGYTNNKRAISSRLLTLAEALQRVGYETVGISTNPHVTVRNGLSQGFDTFSDILTFQDTDAAMVDRLFFEWLDARESQAPFFAMLWYVDPHTPYKPPQEKIDAVVPEELRHLVGERTWRPRFRPLSEDEKRVTRLLYRGEVSYYDDQFAGLVAGLTRRGLYDDSLIAFTSDHGESFWEHDGVDGRPVVGHGISLFREETWVPMMIKLPRSRHRGRVETPVSSIDLAPTLVALAGVAPQAPFFDHFRGHDLRPLWEGEDVRTGRGRRVSELLTDHHGQVQVHMESIQQGAARLVRTYVYRRQTYDPPVEWLLDGADHLLERSPTTEVKVRDLRDALETWRQGLRPLPTRPVAPTARDEDLERRLKALGYL